jgi:uncharacterized protein (TIRG00374 family)
LSLSLLALVLAYVPLDAVVTELSNARPVWVISGIGLLFVVRLTSAYRMRIITRHQGMSVSAIDIFKIGLVTSFFGLFLPGYIAGGAIRWHMLSRTDKKGVEAIASIAFDRVNDTIVLISLGCMCLAAGTPSAASPVVPWILTGTLAVLLVLYTVLLNPRAIRFSAWVTKIIGLYQRPWFNRLFTRLADSMQQFRRFPGLVRLRLWGLSLASHLIGTMVFVFFAGAVNLELSFADCAWLRAILYLLFLFPLSVSGIGVREGALIVLLAPFGITSTQAVAYSFIMMAGLLIMVGIGGLLMPGMLGRVYKARPG